MTCFVPLYLKLYSVFFNYVVFENRNNVMPSQKNSMNSSKIV